MGSGLMEMGRGGLAAGSLGLLKMKSQDTYYERRFHKNKVDVRPEHCAWSVGPGGVSDRLYDLLREHVCGILESLLECVSECVGVLAFEDLVQNHIL